MLIANLRGEKRFHHLEKCQVSKIVLSFKNCWYFTVQAIKGQVEGRGRGGGKLSFSNLGAEQLGRTMNEDQMPIHFYFSTWDSNSVPSTVIINFSATVTVVPNLGKVGYPQINSGRDLRGRDGLYFCIFYREEKENNHEMKNTPVCS